MHDTIIPISKVVPYVGTWIEIKVSPGNTSITSSRSLRGNVDRNQSIMPVNYAKKVVPYVGTWIEIHSSLSGFLGREPSFPTWERG